jgi:hypothetical protein
MIRDLLKSVLELCYNDGDINIKVKFNTADRAGKHEVVFLCNDIAKTEKVLKVSAEEFAAIKDNLLTMIDKKGNYLNIPELCFAFNGKKRMNKDSVKEYLKRTLNIIVIESGEVSVTYRLSYFKKGTNKFIRLLQSGKNVADFICHEQGGCVYLVPFAVAVSKRQIISKVFLQKYNFFSVYELTSEELPRKIKYEKLSAFFISVPHEDITLDGSVVVEKIEAGVRDLIKTYGQYFVLDVYELANTELRYGLRPRTYAFGFIRNFITTSKLTQSLSEEFLKSVCIQFPGENGTVAYPDLKETAFSYVKKEVSDADHHSGKAYRTYILARREEMLKQLAGHSDKTMYLCYEWASGTEFYYEFIRPDGVFIVESKVKPGLHDYGLHSDFKSFAAKQLFRYFEKGNFIEDEEALEALFVTFDDAFKCDYKVNMRYYQLYVARGEKRDVVNISKIKIGNLRNAMRTIEKRRERFDSERAFEETAKMLVNVFTQGKDLIICLTELKKQGVQITLVTDAGGKTRFSVYGNLFLIPARATATEILDIIGDIGAILDTQMWAGRQFDFPFMKVRYFFNANTFYNILKGEYPDFQIGDALSVLPNFYICDLKMDKVALIDKSDKLIDVVDIDSRLEESIPEEYTKKDLKIVLLREDCSKPEIADVLEWVIIGYNKGLISSSYTGNVQPNLVLSDQIPYYVRPIPQIKLEEFNYLRGEIRKLNGYHGKREIVKQTAYRNYFAKDVNHKLFGYGGCCPICGIESENINSFSVRPFTLELISALDGMENIFKFALYMCANDVAAADGWIIEDVSIGGMNPFMWLNEMISATMIAPEFLRCSIRMTNRVTGVIPASDVAVARIRDGKAFDTPKNTIDFILSPLMAAKWLEDNLSE